MTSPAPPRRWELRVDVGHYLELKDPCPVYDGTRWHLFGTAIPAPHTFEILHATADELTGPWHVLAPVDGAGLAGSCVAAPGVAAENGRLHLFLQTEYNRFGGVVEHLVSDDGGVAFRHARTALTALPGTDEAGLYDPHPCTVHGQRYLAYSAFSTIGSPDVHVARSTSATWDGPWERLGPVLRHEHVAWQARRDREDYEWGLEAPQLLELPDGRVLLVGVCFLPGGLAGTRQRVFMAVAADPLGPYEVLGPVIEPEEAGENGHGCAVVDRGDLWLFYQERTLPDPRWRLALAEVPIPGAHSPRLAQPAQEVA